MAPSNKVTFYQKDENMTILIHPRGQSIQKQTKLKYHSQNKECMEKREGERRGKMCILRESKIEQATHILQNIFGKNENHLENTIDKDLN